MGGTSQLEWKRRWGPFKEGSEVGVCAAGWGSFLLFVKEAKRSIQGRGLMGEVRVAVVRCLSE